MRTDLSESNHFILAMEVITGVLHRSKDGLRWSRKERAYLSKGLVPVYEFAPGKFRICRRPEYEIDNSAVQSLHLHPVKEWYYAPLLPAGKEQGTARVTKCKFNGEGKMQGLEDCGPQLLD